MSASAGLIWAALKNDDLTESDGDVAQRGATNEVGKGTLEAERDETSG